MADESFDPDAYLAQKGGAPSAPSASIDDIDLANFNPDAYLKTKAVAKSDALQKQYGSLPQQALTAVEGGISGYATPIATAALGRGLTSLGVSGFTPEEQEARAKASPWLHGGFEALGLGAGIFTGTGEAALMTKAGQTVTHALVPGARAAIEAAQALKIAEKAGKGVEAAKIALKLAERGQSLSTKLIGSALTGAVETGVFQAGDEGGKLVNGDPNQTVSSALQHIGLSGAIGAGGGAVFGAISPLWQKVTGSKVEQAITDMNSAMDGVVIDHAAAAPLKELQEAGAAEALGRLKKTAPQNIAFAEEHGLPILEGMIADSKHIRRLEDGLINGPTTLASIARAEQYNKAWDGARKLVEDSIASPYARTLSETEAGAAVKDSLIKKLEAENEPIKALYNALEPYQEAIPVMASAKKAIAKNIEAQLKKTIGADRRNYLTSVADMFGNVDSLATLKEFRTEVGRATGPLTKDLSQMITGQLNGLEEDVINGFAKTMKTSDAKNKILSLLDTTQEAKGLYRAFRAEMQKLGNTLGKKNIHGAQDFMDFVQEMNPQALGKKIFNENNTEFASYFAKQFPDEMAIMKEYQRGLIRTNAMKGEIFDPKAATKAIFDPKAGMEPEMQKILFNEQELNTLKGAKTYLGDFPEDFNPSHTSHAGAFRALFEKGLTGIPGAVAGNVRDAAILAYIKAMGPQISKKEAGQLFAASANAIKGKPPNAPAFKHMLDLMLNAIRGDNAAGRAAKSVFNATIPVGASLIPSDEHTSRLDKALQKVRGNPDTYASVGGQMGHYLPQHDIAMKAHVSQAVEYLESIRPGKAKAAPLDPEIEPDRYAKAAFTRALQIAEKPLSIISSIKDGTLTDQDVGHLKSMYPVAYSRMAQKLMDELAGHVSKGNPVPYQTRISISRFLGQPMDSSMTPQAIAMNQMALAKDKAENGQNVPRGTNRASSSQVGMREIKVAGRYGLHSKEEA